jgi:hypothetical protein
MTVERKTLDIVLTNRDNIEGEVLCIVEQEVVQELVSLSKERENLAKRSEKLNNRRWQVVRYARKRINQFAKSRQIAYNEKTHAIGIYDNDIIYVGDLDRLKLNPTLAPEETDEIRGRLTKIEKRLYSEVLQNYVNLNTDIEKYIGEITKNEHNFMMFEKKILKDKEYHFNKHFLTISVVDGKVYLCDKMVEDNVEETQIGEQIQIGEEKEQENGTT